MCLPSTSLSENPFPCSARLQGEYLTGMRVSSFVPHLSRIHPLPSVEPPVFLLYFWIPMCPRNAVESLKRVYSTVPRYLGHHVVSTPAELSRSCHTISVWRRVDGKGLLCGKASSIIPVLSLILLSVHPPATPHLWDMLVEGIG